jgi:hypothetical protein
MVATFKYNKEILIAEIQRLAKELNQRYLTSTQFRLYSKACKTTNTILRHFGSWNNAVKLANLYPNHERIENFGTLYKRKKISLKVALKILTRDRFKCCICGKSPATDETTILHIDHSVPVARGGKSDEKNLWTLCQHCNLKKSSKIDFEAGLRARERFYQNIPRHACGVPPLSRKGNI